jgi:hypothetical protein
MTRSIVESISKPTDNACALIDKLIDTCPANLWEEKAGKWPIWQHVLHAAGTMDLFVPGDPIAPPEGATKEVGSLSTVGTKAVTKEALAAYFKACQAKGKAYFAGLQDADLPKEDSHLKAIGLDWTVVQTLVVLSAHINYHVGNADAVLRANGHPGVF